MRDPLTIVGSSVASLTAALAAARRGHPVTLCYDPPRLGGSFAGIAAHGRRLDLGSRLFELEYEDAPPRPIEAFDPQHGTHRPVIAPVASFIRDILKDDLRAADTPELFIAGRRTRCPLMTVDVSDLPASLPERDRSLIRTQLATILGAPPAALEDPTLERASLAQHGARLHELLIEPICAKQHPAWHTVPANDRRKLWAALFHTTTLSEAFSGRPVAFRPHRPFTTTSRRQAYPFVQALVAATLSEPRIEALATGPLTGFDCTPQGSATFRFAAHTIQAPSAQCAIGTPADRLFQPRSVPWQPDRMMASIIWLAVPKADIHHAPSALLIADKASPILRIAHSGSHAGSTVFAIEFGFAPPCPAAAADVLRHTGLVAERAEPRLLHRLFGPAQPVPSPANRLAFQAGIDRFARLPITLLAGARRFGFDSLNDQIADGLYFGATRC